MSYRAVRKTFLDYFVKHGHVHVPSSPVVPSFHDRSCLFVNAGMFQFKNKFLGQQHPDYPNLTKAVNSQKCVRISGKHNDLDVVGKDGNHHTFFEMLGNWSFGDYSDEAACHMALDLLVNHYKLPISKLYITYFGGGEGLSPDLRVKDIWISLGIPENQIVRGHVNVSNLDKMRTDNFWAMGSSGPCGTCTEIYYDVTGFMDDRDFFYASHIDRLEEVWNIVMIRYNRQAETGKLVPLPCNHIDTGMGFERLVKVLEGKDSNYETSIFSSLIEYLEQVNGRGLKFSESEGVDKQAFQTLLDHMRCLSVAITDGAAFSQGGRGPPLKQILKRAIWFSEQVLHIDRLDWHKIVGITGDMYSDIFPEIQQRQEATVKTINNEVEKARKHLHRGELNLKRYLESKHFSLEHVRRQFETRGFPLEVSRLICKDYGINFTTHDIAKLQVYTPVHNPEFLNVSSDFPDLRTTYPKIKAFLEASGSFPASEVESNMLNIDDVRVMGVVQDDEVSQHAKSGKASLVLDRSCFFPASKGSVSDTGTLTCGDTVFEVQRVEWVNDLLIHHGEFTETSDSIDLTANSFNLSVNAERRLSLSRAHTALAIAAYSVAREFAIKSGDLGIVQATVGLDRATLTVDFQSEVTRKWAECARSCELFVSSSFAHRKISNPSSGAPIKKDILSFGEVNSPFHKLISYPCTQFKPTNLSLSSMDPDLVSLSLNVLSSAPFSPDIESLGRLEILDVKNKKAGHTQLYITCGPIAEDIYQSVKELSAHLPSIYKLYGRNAQVEALRELSRGKNLPYRFRYLLRAKKLWLKSEVGSKYFGLFGEENFR